MRVRKVCSISDCEKPYYCRGWCDMHYRRWRRHNDPKKTLRPGYTKHRSKVCTLLDCDYPHFGRGFCQRHYEQWYDRNVRRKSIQRRLSSGLRCRMRKALKGRYKNGSAVRDLGISISKFRLYIENQFEPGMTWDNYGEWHLDHMIPLAKFDLTDRQQFLQAVNWLNYQPLWAMDNILKGKA